MAAVVALRTKRPTPLSTHALAAFLTWKQFDLLLLLREEEPSSTVANLAADLEDIKEYDVRHGGAFYASVGWQSVYSCLRSLERRRLVDRHVARNGLFEWTISERGVKALDWLDAHS